MAEAARPAITIGDDAPPVMLQHKRVLGVSVATWPKILMPLAVGILALAGWELAVRLQGIPVYILPGLAALSAAVVLGVSLSVLFAQSKWVELSFFPYAVILQVTPIVAIAPLIIIWVNDVKLSLLICAWIVAFFPILSNTTLGLNSADHNLLNLFQLYKATRFQTLMNLRLPSALPYFLGGLKISGGLALIGAVVAEFVAGTGGSQSGLAYRILESGYQLRIPRMFAALFMISISGIVIFMCLSLLSHLVLRRWHESALKREN